MARAKNRIREERIKNQAVADAYGREERAVSWYCCLERKLCFPFFAKCTAAAISSPLRTEEAVEVRRMAPENICSSDMLVLIRWQGRTLAVPLSQLAPMEADEATTEAMGDWSYWIEQGYRF